MSAQQAPNDSSRDRVDITVRYLRGDEHNKFMATLMVCEVKRLGTGELKEVEKQVQKAAKSYLDSTGDALVYCITAWGVKARCWLVQRADVQSKLQPMFGPDKSACKEAYIDANSDEAVYINASISYIKGESEIWPQDLAQASG